MTAVPPPRPLALRDAMLGIAVMAVWGTNFVVIRIGLDELPPLLFAALRFLFAGIPAILLLRRPAVSWGSLAAYGVLIGAGQFGLLFIAMGGHISPGLASLVVQTQVVFTILLAMWITREKVLPLQWAAIMLAGSGLVVIGLNSGPDGATLLGLVLVVMAALAWAAGNLVAKAAGPVNMLAFVVWASLFSVPPLLALSLVFEGWPAILAGVRHASGSTWTIVLWQSAGNTLFGYAAWAWLLARYPAATVAPLALLVPAFGMSASAWWLAEPLQPWKLAAAVLVLSGLAINLLLPRLRTRLRGTP